MSSRSVTLDLQGLLEIKRVGFNQVTKAKMSMMRIQVVRATVQNSQIM